MVLDLFLEAVKVLRSRRYVTDETLGVFGDGSHKRLNGCTGINSTVRDSLPGIW